VHAIPSRAEYAAGASRKIGEFAASRVGVTVAVARDQQRVAFGARDLDSLRSKKVIVS
jgi:hypothetical protein